MSTAPADPRSIRDRGELYEPYIGRWSRAVARVFLDWLAPDTGLRWLDVGAGTGALSRTILDQCAPAAVVGVDPSLDFVAYARARTSDPRVTFEVGDARTLRVPDADFDVVVSGLLLNFVPDRRRVLGEMRRAVRPGGTVAAYVWDYEGQMEMMRRFWDAAVALDPTAAELDEKRRFPAARPGPLAALFTRTGLSHVDTRAIDVPTVFRDFDDYWTPFLGGQGSAPAYCLSLPEDHRAALRERLRRTLPIRADGTIHLSARAWAARGRRP